jgi:hypothetical protein
MCKKKLWRSMAGFSLLGGVALLAVLSFLPERDIGQECYDRIQLGMRVSEARDILKEAAPHAQPRNSLLSLLRRSEAQADVPEGHAERLFLIYQEVWDVEEGVTVVFRYWSDFNQDVEPSVTRKDLWKRGRPGFLQGLRRRFSTVFSF